MAKKVGSIILATEQGLGYLARDFFTNGLIQKVFIHEHSSRVNHREWYSRESIVSSTEELLETCQVLIFFETPFEWSIIKKAREKGIKTILIPMYECTRFPFPYEPDEIWCPSALDHKFYGDKSTRQIQIPVNVEWRLREKAKVFVHNAGNGGLGGRNGTKELLEAMEYVKSPIKLIVRSQIPIKIPNDSRIDLRIGTFDDIWSEGDVFIFPEKFNGLSLPLQEAYASGMLLMCGNRFPMNDWLPKESLIPVSGYHKERIAVEFDCAEFSPQEIAKKIDAWYDKDIINYSLLGKTWGQNNSWKKQKEVLEKLLLQ